MSDDKVVVSFELSSAEVHAVEELREKFLPRFAYKSFFLLGVMAAGGTIKKVFDIIGDH